MYPKLSEISSSSTTTKVTLHDLIKAAHLCLEERLASHSLSDENFSKLKLALEQINTTIERTEQIHKTLDHLEHLPNHMNHYDNDSQIQKTSLDHIGTKFYPSIDCGQHAREMFRDQMSKRTSNSFVTCCDTIVMTSADDSNSNFMNNDTTIIRCQIPATLPSVPETMADDKMLKDLECLLLNEPLSMLSRTAKNEDLSFVQLEQECQRNSELCTDSLRQQTILETNIAALSTKEKIEDDSQKENITPEQEQQSVNDVQLDHEIHLISPIISVPIRQ